MTPAEAAAACNQVFADGGCVKKNPSPYAGTCAWVYALNGDMLWSGTLLLPAAEWGPIGNNLSEFAAVLAAIEMLPRSWVGMVYTDSAVTIQRFKQLMAGRRLKGLPAAIADRAAAAIDRVGVPLQFVLVDGHPTRAELTIGRGKRGYPTHRLNVHCDDLCSALARRSFPALY